jgi:hypothetical protein
MVSLLSPFARMICVSHAFALHVISVMTRKPNTHMLVTSDATHVFSHFAGLTLDTSKPCKSTCRSHL